jgi:cold-inducible RNA-binding protein
MKNLCVGNLAFSKTERELRALFEIHGVVEAVNIVTDKETWRPRGFAFVEMTSPGEADKPFAAITGSSLGGRALKASGSGKSPLEHRQSHALRIRTDKGGPSEHARNLSRSRGNAALRRGDWSAGCNCA